MKKPNIDQYYAIQAACDDVIENESQSGALGRHWILMNTLNEAGYRVNSTREAMELAAKILAGGHCD
jgi:hypothetical protein